MNTLTAKHRAELDKSVCTAETLERAAKTIQAIQGTFYRESWSDINEARRHEYRLMAKQAIAIYLASADCHRSN